MIKQKWKDLCVHLRESSSSQNLQMKLLSASDVSELMHQLHSTENGGYFRFRPVGKVLLQCTCSSIIY